MKMTKRILSLVLCFVMLVGLMPNLAFLTGAEETTGTVLDAALFFSDLHTSSSNYKESTIKSVMGGAKSSGLDFSTVTSVGDAFSSNNTVQTGSTSRITDAIRTGLGDTSVEVFYAWSDHDRGADIDNFTGLLYGSENTNYYIYTISMSDMTSDTRYGVASTYSADKLTAFTQTIAGLDHSKPLFIASHVPLHDRRDDNQYADEWYSVISAAAEMMDIAFFWGHNHTEENAADLNAYYVAKDGSETLTIEGIGSVVPNFTYLNAGYVSPSTSTSSTRTGVVTTAALTSDNIIFTVYGSSGVYTGNYALNETVKREFARTEPEATEPEVTEPEVTEPEATEPEASKPGIVKLTDDATGIAVAAPGITGLTVTEIENPTYDSQVYGAYASYDITLTGYTDGAAADVTIPAPAGFDVSKPAVVLHEGVQIVQDNDISDGITFTTTHFSVYDVAQTAESNLDWREISKEQDKTIFRLTNSLTAGKKYVIVSRNTAGAGNAVNLNGTSINSTGVTVIADAAGNYIEAPATTAQWTYSSSRFANVSTTNRYLRGNNSELGTTTSTNSTTYITWSYSHDSYGLRARQYASYGNTYRYMTSVTSTSSSSSNTNRVYIYVEEKLQSDPLWAAMEGQTSFSFGLNGYSDQAIRDKIHVYTASSNSGDGQVEVYDYTLDSSAVQSGAPGKYTVTVKYQGVTLGTIDVTVSAEPSLKITEGGEEKDQVIRTSVKVGDKIQLGVKAFNGTTNVTNPEIIWSIAEKDAGKATVDQNGLVTILDNNSSFMVHASWPATGKTDFIEIGVSPDSYLTPNVSTNDFPQYPNQGAIRYDKTAEAVGNFSETGVTQLELSMTGIPYGKGVDVVVVIDTSSSMRRDKDGDDVGYSNSNSRFYIMKQALRSMLNQFDGNNVDLAIVDFNGYSNSPTSANGNNYISGSNLVGDNNGYRNEANKGKIYTGNGNGAYILNTTLSASHFENTGDTEFNDTRINQILGYFTEGSTGTNYDFGLESAYKLLAAKKAANGDTARDQYVIFLTDGSPFRYNGFTNENNDGRNEMDKVLSGDYASVAALKSAFTWMSDDVANMYYPVNGTHPHRMAEAIKGTPGKTYYAVDSTNTTPYLKPYDGLGAKFYSIGFCIADDKTSSTSSDVVKETTSHEIVRVLSSGEGYYWEDLESVEALSGAFVDIAKKISEAATDIVVTDKITEQYTMIFGVPQTSATDEKSTERNNAVAEALEGQDLYIEVVNYHLDAKHERTTTVDTLSKIYLRDSNGTAAGGTYSASIDNSGTAAPALAFSAKDGDKPAYWAQVAADYAVNPSDIVINVNGTNWKFMEKGDGTHNVTAGAYAFGNIDAKTNMSEDLVIVTPYFAYSASTRVLAWTADKVEEFRELALRYFLYLDHSSADIGVENVEVDPGTYPTNEWAYITYTNHLGHDCRREYPVPQMTWNGAQVSYVFYLVNEAGQPINKAGEVIDFANATFITDIFTEAVVWNDTDTPTTEEGVAYLDAQWMAKDKLPEGYVLYDGTAYYELKVYEDHAGNNLDNYFRIDGSETGGNNESTTKVYNSKAGAKYSAYGTYKEADVASGFDFAHTTVAFAVVWKLQLNPDTVVVDYGLDVLVNVVENDLMSNTLTGISKTERNNLAINTAIAGNSAFSSQTLDYTDYVFSVEGENQIRFHQKNMQFKEPAKIYYETKSTDYIDGKARTGYMYSSLTVIPATTIYYEDSFVTLTSYTKQNDGSYLKDDNSAWAVVGSNINSVQQQDRPGASQISAALDADNNYGYDAAYKNMATYSMGASRKIHLTPGHDGQADFDFWGTGFDVISLTSNKTGTIIVQVYPYDDNGVQAKEPTQKLVVDTYYGYVYGLYKVTYTYTVNSNGTGRWVITEQVPVDEAGTNGTAPENPKAGDTYTIYEEKWVAVDSNIPNALYQVPVMKVEGLTYGKYHAKIVAFYDEFFDSTGDSAYDFYLDAIRIYDPTGNQNTEANDAYIQDGEGWPTYEEVRDYVITQSTYDELDGEGEVEGIVFVDGVGDTKQVADYASFGPNNELYLAPGQAIAFVLEPGANVAKVQMALKTVGGSGDVKITGIVNGNAKTILNSSISSATDMYYTIWEQQEKQDAAPESMTLLIENTGDAGEAILSITNVKITHAAQPGARTMMFAVRRPAIEEALETMIVETEPEITEPTEPEITEPTEPETEPTVPETEVTEPTVPETEPTEPETEPTEPSGGNKNEQALRDLVEIIKGILGWIFG